MFKTSYLILQSCLWVTFIGLDLFSAGPATLSDSLKYCGLLLCLTFLLSQRKKAATADWQQLLLGMILTIGCDYFLLFTDAVFFPLLAFAAVHGIYIIRSLPHLQRKTALCYFSGALLLLSALQLGFIKDSFGVGLFYGAFLLADVAAAFRSHHPRKKILQAALSLFFLCDVAVAIFNLSSNEVRSLVGPLMWAFYLPAQVLLSLSLAKTDNTEDSK